MEDVYFAIEEEMKIELNVKTNSKESKVVFEGDVYYLYVKSSAREGKANREMIKLLSEYFDIPKGNISIKSGQRYRKKVVEISGLSSN